MIRVGVIRGGSSNEYDASLETGAHILSHLRGDKLAQKYAPVDIFISKDGTWHIYGMPRTLEQIAQNIDVAINALHGGYGEDGTVARELSKYQIPYTGSSVIPSAVAFNNEMAKEHYAGLGIQTPRHILFPAYFEDMDGPREEYARKKAREVWERLPPPYIVKPLTRSSFMGMHVCKTFPELVRAFEVGVGQNTSILVEEMIEGRNVSVGVINNFRGRNAYPLVPEGGLSSDEKRELERLAEMIHSHMKFDGYSETRFVVAPKKGIYAIESSTSPKLHENSTIDRGLEFVGSSVPEFIDHIINQALKKNI